MRKLRPAKLMLAVSAILLLILAFFAYKLNKMSKAPSSSKAAMENSADWLEPEPKAEIQIRATKNQHDSSISYALAVDSLSQQEVEEILIARLAASDTPSVVIKVEDGIELENLARIMDIAKRKGSKLVLHAVP